MPTESAAPFTVPQPRTRLLTVRITDAEADLLATRARNRGATVSGLVRDALRAEIERVDQPTAA